MREVDDATANVPVGCDRGHRNAELTEVELFWGRYDAEGVPSGTSDDHILGAARKDCVRQRANGRTISSFGVERLPKLGLRRDAGIGLAWV